MAGKGRRFRFGLMLGLVCGLTASSVQAAPSSTNTAGATPPPGYRKITAFDADEHTIVLNRPAMICLVLCTGEESQDMCRAAGKSVYFFQGRPDFQVVVVADLRDSMATWVPSIAIGRMRTGLDNEAKDVKKYYEHNGNFTDPRKSVYVVPDFDGKVCIPLGWKKPSDDLRGILFGADGREITRWEKIEDVTKIYLAVRAAIQANMDAIQAKAAAAAKTQGSKVVQPPQPLPPLPPAVPPPMPK